MAEAGAPNASIIGAHSLSARKETKQECRPAFPPVTVRSLPLDLYPPPQSPCLSDWKWVGCEHVALCGLCDSNSKYSHRCYGPGHKEGDRGSSWTTAGFCWLSTAPRNMLNLNVSTRTHCSQVHLSPYRALFPWFELI